eukprot:gb/GEZN01011953.1/.p1 GENE.gb/GEZN01011953.1/~~gb/GEZN01011953.1/.p1  ORF type:complete len:333 (+),score=32.47 gb/GEZN01011953.1/:72-1070(+)
MSVEVEPPDVLGYGAEDYWNLRYQLSVQPFDWYVDPKVYVSQVLLELKEDQNLIFDVCRKEFQTLQDFNTGTINFPKFEKLVRAKGTVKYTRRRADRQELEETWTQIATVSPLVDEKPKKKPKPKKNPKKNKLKRGEVRAEDQMEEQQEEPEEIGIRGSLDFTGFYAWWSRFNAGPPMSGMKVLVVGCGTSGVPFELRKVGFGEVVALDISGVVVGAMKERYRGITGLSFEVGDVLQLPYPPQNFDLVLDKGTLDSLLCTAASEKAALDMLAACHRTLRPGGVLMVLSAGPLAIAQSRMPLFKAPKFNWTTKTSSLRGFSALEFWSMFMPIS